MFSKKPYGPAHCASCDKGLTNLYGHKAEYNTWRQLPFRESDVPIARYGKGFSKTLSQVKLEMSTEETQNVPSALSTRVSKQPQHYRSNSQIEEPKMSSLPGVSQSTTNLAFKYKKDGQDYLNISPQKFTGKKQAGLFRGIKIQSTERNKIYQL